MAVTAGATVKSPVHMSVGVFTRNLLNAMNGPALHGPQETEDQTWPIPAQPEGKTLWPTQGCAREVGEAASGAAF